jgi:hypothetical protein
MNPAPSDHATKMAEMVLSVAPHANIFDLPLLPSHILGLQGYLAWAAGMYWNFLGLIPWLRQFPRFRGPWVLCNAWAVYDLRDDPPLLSPFNYGQNPANGLNLAVTLLPLYGWSCSRPAILAPTFRGAASWAAAFMVWRRSTTSCPSRQRQDLVGAAELSSIKPDLCAPSQACRPADWGRAWPRHLGQPVRHGHAAARSFPTKTLARSQWARAIATASTGQRNGAQPARRIRVDIHALSDRC